MSFSSVYQASVNFEDFYTSRSLELRAPVMNAFGAAVPAVSGSWS